MRVFLAISVSAAACSAWPAATTAQTVSEIESSGAVCMAKLGDEGASFNIILPERFRENMLGKGYNDVACASVFGAKSRVATYRDTVCDMASNSSNVVQDNYEETLGERPAVLCAFAEAVLGDWERQEQRVGE